ncbi:two-component regulator propeller domain-containing protein [Chitinophagaceae bacterium LWZ2-11]
MLKTVALIRLFIINAVIICGANTAFAQHSYIFEHLFVENGLSQSSVVSITQDAAGFMWFGTRNKLNRYDTKTFKIYSYNKNDTTSITTNDYIFALLKDSKNNLWVGTQRGLNIYVPEKDAFIRIVHDSALHASISDNYVNCIYEDKAGNIWVGTNDGLNKLTGSKPYSFTRFKAKQNGQGLINGDVHSVCEDKDGNIWVGTTNGLTKMTPEGTEYVFTSYQNIPGNSNSLSADNIFSIVEDKKGNLWIGTDGGGLNLFNKKTGTCVRYMHNPALPTSISSNTIRKMIVDKSNNLWIGTMDGLDYFDTNTNSFTVYKYDPENPNSLSNNSIRDVFEDKYGSVWIGTVFGGVNVIHELSTPFTIYKNSNLRNSISSNVVSNIVADEHHNLWIGTEAEGVNYFDKRTKQFTHYKHDPQNANSLSANFIKSIYKDKANNIWIGTYDGGLNRFNVGSHNFTHYKHDANNPLSISGDYISCIKEDTEGRFWVGSYGKGINLFNKTAETFQSFTSTSDSKYKILSNWVRVIFEDSKKNLWIGEAGGLNLLPPGADKFIGFTKGTGKKNSLTSDYINCIIEDKAGRIWIGTYDGGLCLYNPQTKDFTAYTTANGLPGNNVRGILEDEQGCLWLSTDNGLSKFDTKRNSFINYTVNDGLPGNEFNYNSYYKDDDGQLFFGSYTGLISFYPDNIKVNEFVPPVVFTGLKLFNLPVGINDGNKLLDKDMSLTKSITFSYKQNIFTVEFAALNYIKSAKNKYAYQLSGFEKTWNYVSNPSATYTNLPSGHYKLLVKGTNNDGVWNNEPASLDIIVLPPFWLTWWAYLIYVIVFSAIFYLIIRFFRIRARLERDLYYEHQQTLQQEELHQMKIDFFTNISHEIRTPLTLILGPLERLIQQTKSSQFFNKQLQLAKSNADRLAKLVNELLDFRKAESGNMKVYLSNGNIVRFTKEVFSSFEDLAESKQIEYYFESSEETLFAYFDSTQLEKVLFNLLANAFKFTKPGGRIAVVIQQIIKDEQVRISVIDNGKGIPTENLSGLFEKFYQVESFGSKLPGTGLGLALAKNIIELHKGKIEVSSTSETENNPGNTCFSISLPLSKQHTEVTEQLPTVSSSAEVIKQIDLSTDEINLASSEATDHSFKKPVVLLVEDNPEIREFVKTAFEVMYDVEEASSGVQGWEKACDIIPDIVISDVMMDGENAGFELCKKIKSDERTNHIPVILLTARVATGHQISGLQFGADAYITKPFNMQVLELQVRNLLSLRELIRHKFNSQITLQPQKAVTESQDEVFLNKLVEIVEANMEDPDFGVPVLLKKVAMSQTVLYRKLKALTDMSIADFIKSVRLKKAALLFQQNNRSIADVAYAVGFSDRKYFSKEFRKQFGQSPSEYLGAVSEE